MSPVPLRDPTRTEDSSPISLPAADPPTTRAMPRAKSGHPAMGDIDAQQMQILQADLVQSQRTTGVNAQKAIDEYFRGLSARDGGREQQRGDGRGAGDPWHGKKVGWQHRVCYPRVE